MTAEVISFRPMRDDDIPRFREWLQRAHVRAWWDAREAEATVEELRATYAASALARCGVQAYIARIGERRIGWVQSYVALGAGGGWWEDETDPGVRGIDAFLCDADTLGRGLGTRMVRAFVRQLLADPAVTHVQTDPAPENARAIRCYEKAGFRQVKEIVTPDGPAVLMICSRPSASRSFTAGSRAVSG